MTSSGSPEAMKSVWAGVVSTNSAPLRSTFSAGIGHDAEPAFGQGHHLPIGQTIFARAQEGEIVLGQPVEEQHGLVAALGRGGPQIDCRTANPLQHGLPAGDGAADIGHGGLQLGLHGADIGDRIAVDMQDAERLRPTSRWITGWANRRMLPPAARTAASALSTMNGISGEMTSITSGSRRHFGRQQGDAAGAALIAGDMGIGAPQNGFQPIGRQARQVLGGGGLNCRF